MSLAFAVIATLLVAAASPSSAVPPGSVGPGASGKTVTIAARVCDNYTDVRANRSRDDLMESLQDLGPDTNYLPGELVNPAKEDASPQNACKPLENWQFTFGKQVTFPFGNPAHPSTVSSTFFPDPTSIVTQASVPELDASGAPTGGTVAGATTIELSDDQFNSSKVSPELGLNFFWGLWLQGGTPADPLLNDVYPNQYGFATLRCGNDYLHGDNVEYINFPTEDTNHLFCYAYYVSPPPGVGTIIVQKQLNAGTDTQTFPFSGTLSYNPGGRFDLAVTNGQMASQTFYRGSTAPGGNPWVVTEDAVEGWELSGSPSCTSTGGSALSTTANSASITLAPGDVVTCTFTNQRVVPPPAVNPETAVQGAQESAAVQGASTLPETGSATGALTASGLGSLVAGLGLVLLARRRRLAENGW